jgi:hypothetical protein
MKGANDGREDGVWRVGQGSRAGREGILTRRDTKWRVLEDGEDEHCPCLSPLAGPCK